MSFKSWWTANVVAPNPDQEDVSALDVRDGVVIPNVDGSPAFRLVVRDGVAFIFDPTLGPLDARSSMERHPVMPKAAQPVIPAVES